MMHQPFRTEPHDQHAARLRVALAYWWRHGRVPDLSQPALFTELIQWRKLYDRDPRMPALADKVRAKGIVAGVLGRQWVVPTLWTGQELPRRSLWQGRVAIKARHGCNQNAFATTEREWLAARRAAARWMRRPYGRWLDEWLYAHIPRGLLVEPFIGDAQGTLPLDYKVFVFGGEATHVQVHLDRAARHRWIVHDRDWRALAADAPAVPRPSALGAMLAAAEALSTGFAFTRVDFYQPGHQPLFGEMSFYPGSGLTALDPPVLDREMGQLWLAACDGDRAVARPAVGPA